MTSDLSEEFRAWIEQACDDAHECRNQKEVVAPEEVAVLERMRAIRAEANPLRAELTSLKSSADAEADQRRAAIKDQLKELRERFTVYKADLEVANRIKLRRLGHIS